jgi:uncharacterized integral membrane protein
MTFLKWIIITPLALIGLAFAIANRHETTVSFDPFAGNDISSPQITVPLFVLLFAAVVFGAILGGIATWVTQGKNRKAARLAKSEADKWHSEADRLRTQTAATPVARPASSDSRALAGPY